MKRGRGRPKLKDHEETVRFETLVPVSFEEALTRAAKEYGVSKSEVIRTALAKHLNLVEV